MASILLAEDDQSLGFLLDDTLKDHGHEVCWTKNGEEALTAFRKSSFDICIVDVMMPKMDGFELARNIRESDSFTPILFLTAKSMEEDKLRGFEIGGDDYITKPFSMQELNYRIAVFLRRSDADAQRSQPTSAYEFGESSYDPENLCYRCVDHAYSLTEMEGKLLELLLKSQNQLVRRETILETIWGENDYFKGRSLDVFITRLRKYLKLDETIEIKNHHGVGFSLLIKKM